ncbi:hypothetical protein P7C70_g4237, partial [Phenoliferia sp. Uapishka_3]
MHSLQQISYRRIRRFAFPSPGAPYLSSLLSSNSTRPRLIGAVATSQHQDGGRRTFFGIGEVLGVITNQMEGYFAVLPEIMGEGWGWEAFEKESWAFKHDRLGIEKRVNAGGVVKTSDIAHLMELFQSALLKYWEFEPMTETDRKGKKKAAQNPPPSPKSDAKNLIKKSGATSSSQIQPHDLTEATMREGWGSPAVDLRSARTVGALEENEGGKKEGGDEEVEKVPTPAPKKIPVFFIDEAHKLPALIQAEDAMKSLLDSDPEAHATFSKALDQTNEHRPGISLYFPFLWKRALTYSPKHCHILSVGDCSKAEARKYFDEDLYPHIPDKLKPLVHFNDLYRFFGGKLAHLADYTSEYINSDGSIPPIQSSHFLQAHSLINLQLIHSTPSKITGDVDTPGFEIYSPLKAASPHAAPTPFTSSSSSPGSDFSNVDLLKVMARLAPKSAEGNDEVAELAYFPLCRELGARAVDGLVRARILELRWCDTITEEGDTVKGRPRRKRETIGPVLVPTTPVVRYAMGVVLKEYEQ